MNGTFRTSSQVSSVEGILRYGNENLRFARVFCGVTRHFEKYPEGPGDEVGVAALPQGKSLGTRLHFRPSHTSRFSDGGMPIFLTSPTKNRLVWGRSRQVTIKSDLVGGKSNMFDFQTS